ncbi:MAG: hypothetical protein AB7S37_02130 [Methanobacteriales archaeon]|nr:hypothetical protein [Methanothermobacter sp.]
MSARLGRGGRQVVKVNPKGTNGRLSSNDPYRDYIVANRILKWGTGTIL